MQVGADLRVVQIGLARGHQEAWAAEFPDTLQQVRIALDRKGAGRQRHRGVGQGQARRGEDGVRLRSLDEGPQGLEVDHGISQGYLHQGLGGGAQGVGDSGADA